MNESSQVDDPSLDLPLPDELILWRRVPKEKFVFVTDVEGMTHFRPSSDTFADSRDGSSMSVFDSSSCGGLDRILHGHEQFGVVAITVGQMKEAGLKVVRTPTGGPGHCEVVGKKTGSVKNKLVKASVWVVGPTNDL
jgi:hypothetical protein